MWNLHIDRIWIIYLGMSTFQNKCVVNRHIKELEPHVRNLSFDIQTKVYATVLQDRWITVSEVTYKAIGYYWTMKINCNFWHPSELLVVRFHGSVMLLKPHLLISVNLLIYWIHRSAYQFCYTAKGVVWIRISSTTTLLLGDVGMMMSILGYFRVNLLVLVRTTMRFDYVTNFPQR